MILTRILDLLAERKVASLAEIARAVDSKPDAVRSMLQTLQRKGRVHRVEVPGGCGSSCHQCDPGHIEIYSCEAAPDRAVQAAICESRGR